MLVAPDEIHGLGRRLLTEDVVYFPVRHHSPACAWQLRRLIERRTPSCILVEGPRGFSPLIPLLTHAEARLPLAIYTYSVAKGSADGDPVRRAAYYPFCDYSPELIALREAAARGIPARFIDLNFTEQSAIEELQVGDEPLSLLDERHLSRSRYLQELARRQGCRNHDELWEHLFEVRVAERSVPEHVDAVAAYCHLARVDASDDELRRDGTLQREAEMAWHIREAVTNRASGAGPVLVVLGGFHAVAMPALVAAAGARPAIDVGGLTDESNALIRYGFERLDRLHGYTAGMTSPAWHQRAWETLPKHEEHIERHAHARRELALSVLGEIAHDLRERHDMSIPVSTLQAAYEQALRLSTLRGRPAPSRDDLVDAIMSCFIKGDVATDGFHVQAVTQQHLTGRALGRVPPGAGTPPLVRDFEYRARRHRLKIDDSAPRRVLLDLYRRTEHRATSRLLHGLAFLGVPFATRTAGPNFVAGTGLDRLQERWEYTHSAATEAALVEAAVHGNTVPLAVATRYLARLGAFESASTTHDASEAVSLLVQGFVLGLHDHVTRAIGVVARAIASDADFVAVAKAAASLGVLCESREPLEARDAPAVSEVMRAAYERALYLGPTAASGSDDDLDAVDALLRLRELVISQAGRDLDAQLFWSMIHELRQNTSGAMLRGASIGLGYGAGRVSETELVAAVSGHLEGLLPIKEAVAFLRGLLLTARESAWQQPAMMEAVDGLLGRWDSAQFVAALPDLRLAFAGMTPKETDRIAEGVARLHGREDLGRLVRHDLSAEQLDAHLHASEVVLQLMREDGLDRWLPS